MTNLKRASQQLFSRPDDERFSTLAGLYDYCSEQRDGSEVYWKCPHDIVPMSNYGVLSLQLVGNSSFQFNDWSFGQTCQLADVKKETINRLRPETAVSVLPETLPSSSKPFQLLTRNGVVRSIHGASYTRFFDAELVEVVIKEADGFVPPPVGFNGATGLYAGEQDMFAFLIDDTAWVDIGGEQFAPGFFIWNSEVGRRTVGIETFWFQRVCSNHIVWDATEVVSYKRKHTANVGNAIDDIRAILRRLIQTRDARRDQFAKVIGTAMNRPLGSTAEDVTKILTEKGLGMKFVKEAVAMMSASIGSFTIFGAVDSLTRISRNFTNAGERATYDSKIGSLLSLAV